MTRSAKLQPALYLVSTPIGNLEDITLRALRVLKECDLIACEDTRQTQKLLNHFGIEKRTLSYHEHNEQTRAAEIVARLEEGLAVAVVSDAGTPGVSDPGYRIVTAALERGITVVPVPGASALLGSLVASGLATDSFRFHGFLPAKSAARRQAFREAKESTVTEIYYEAPHRLLESLADLVAALGPSRPVVVAREVTKLHEEFLRGTASEVLAQLKERGEIRGEITLLVGRAQKAEEAVVPGKSIRQRVRELMTSEGLDEREAMKRLAHELGMGKSEIYREMQKEK